MKSCDIDLLPHNESLFQKRRTSGCRRQWVLSTSSRTASSKFWRYPVVFLPPTLVASSYGMNFEFMPELKWSFGYPWRDYLS
ncbi:CorA family divalent cation transporter [Escherichia coli]